MDIATLAEAAEAGDAKASSTLSNLLQSTIDAHGDNAQACKDTADLIYAAIEPLSNETILPIAKQTFNSIVNKQHIFYKHANLFGYLLAEIYQADGDLHSALQVLNLIDLDKTNIDNYQKIKLALLTSEFYMEINDTVNANKFIKKIQRIIGPHTPVELNLRYQAIYARVLDAERRFLDSCRRYIDLSQLLPNEQDRMISLEKAVTCAILARAGSLVCFTMTKEVQS
jgi:outer membrane PBP1 activator LpoA protein